MEGTLKSLGYDVPMFWLKFTVTQKQLCTGQSGLALTKAKTRE